MSWFASGTNGSMDEVSLLRSVRSMSSERTVWSTSDARSFTSGGDDSAGVSLDVACNVSSVTSDDCGRNRRGRIPESDNAMVCYLSLRGCLS